MNSSFTKIFEGEKLAKKKSLGKNIYASRVIMQSLKSIRLAEVGNFFKQRFEQKNLFHCRPIFKDRYLKKSSEYPHFEVVENLRLTKENIL